MNLMNLKNKNIKPNYPTGWKAYKLGEISEFIGGSQPPKEEFSYEYKDGFVRLIQIRDYKSNDNIVYVKKESVRRFCEEDDIMIGRYGPPVFQILRGLKGAYNVALMKAIPNENIISKEYFFKFLQNPTIQSYIIGLSQRSAGQSGVNKEALENYDISIPSLSEQQLIIKKLDSLFQRIDKAIQFTRENVDHCQHLLPAALNELFGKATEKSWKYLPVFDILSLEKKTITPDLDKEYNIVGLENIEKDTGILINFKPLLGAESISTKVVFEKEMILYGKLRPYLNKVWVASFDGIATTEILPFKANVKKANPHYVAYYFRSGEFLNKVNENCSGARMPRLTTKFWDDAIIPIPDLSVQQRIINYLDKLTEKQRLLQQHYTKQLQHLQAFKAGLLDAAFKGKL